MSNRPKKEKNNCDLEKDKDFQKFLSDCKELKIDIRLHEFSSRGYDSKPTYNPYIIAQWEAGGVSGGSCWDESDPQPYTTNNRELELTDLVTILAKFWPNIFFIQYMKLANDLIEHGSLTDYEYYGNQTDYSFKKVNLKKLYDHLKEQGKI